eukprot:1395374-Amorphochlora_amoeboformis.AAC.1
MPKFKHKLREGASYITSATASTLFTASRGIIQIGSVSCSLAKIRILRMYGHIIQKLGVGPIGLGSERAKVRGNMYNTIISHTHDHHVREKGVQSWEGIRPCNGKHCHTTADTKGNTGDSRDGGLRTIFEYVRDG